MNALLSPIKHDRQFENPSHWVTELHTNYNTLALATDLPVTSLKRRDRILSPKVQTRLQAVHALLNRVYPWFNSWDAAWLWYRSAPLPSFGGCSPSDLVREYGENGLQMVEDHIRRKQAGGFA